MARVTDQDIPAELLDGYKAALNTEPWIFEDDRVRIRHPFRIPTLQGCRTIRPPIRRGTQVSQAMCEHRHVFGDCVKCFQIQPETDGAEPAGYGPYARDWWFTEAIGKLPWYFNYFMRKTIDAFISSGPPLWCRYIEVDGAYVDNQHPSTEYCNTTVLAAWKDRQYLKRSYIKRPPEGVTKLWLKIKGLEATGGYKWPLQINAYEVTAPWDCATLNWNNKPPLGKWLSFVLRYDWEYVWVGFDVGEVDSVAITMDTDLWRAVFEGPGAANVNLRPFWTK